MRKGTLHLQGKIDENSKRRSEHMLAIWLRNLRGSVTAYSSEMVAELVQRWNMAPYRFRIELWEGQLSELCAC